MQSYNLNLIPKHFPLICHASQYDIGRVIRLYLFDDAVPYTLSGSESIKLRIRKLDGGLVTKTITNTASNYVDIITDEDLTNVAGRVYCKLRIDSVGAKGFYLDVEKQP